MQPMALTVNDQLLHRLSQVLYRCLEDVGSTKAALYLAQPGSHLFELACHYGWPRSTPPPPHLGPADPLVLLVQRQRRSFALNDGAAYPELQGFGQGKTDPHYYLSPIYDRGEWIGLLLQRDLNGGETFAPERQEAPTQTICEEIVQAIKHFGAGSEARAGAARPEPPPTLVQEREAIRVPAPPTFPEQRSFFWEAATLLSRMVPMGAVALWIHHPVENLPILTYSALPLAPQLERQVIDHAVVQFPNLAGTNLQLLTKAEYFDQAPIPGPFRTLLPIVLEEQFGGADLLMLFRVEDSPFLPHEQEIIAGVARMLGLYLEEGRLHERYHQSFLSVSHRILATAGERVPYIRAQSVNTAELSRSLARKLQLSSPEVEAVTISAILHDVGTLLLDHRILDKPTLTAEDLELVQTHPILASTFLKDFRFPFDVLRIIRHHHEQWDGKGYPDGIAGDAIPIESRIIHLVESFQIMTSGTAYRAAKPLPEAMDELRRLSGAHFDPRMVEEFIKMVESRQTR
jgi:HD-GYP domain-containing protein (c-di-GMP phosphodiesterase class II)